jgi:purine-binding chemotaxis protein CheW
MHTELEESKQFVVFTLDTQFYGVDITHVEIIEKMKFIVRVPHMPACIEGVMNLRGEIIPIINTRKLFALEEKEETHNTRIIITKIEDSMVGIIVDEVKEVMEIEPGQVESIHDTHGKIEADYIIGVGKIIEKNMIVTLLQLGNIIQGAFQNNK